MNRQPATVKDLVPVGRWSCAKDGAKHVMLRAFVNGTDVVEEFEYACGHVAQRVVSRVLPESHFEEIERRLDRLEGYVWEPARRSA